MPSPFQRSTLGVYSNSNPHISFRTLVTSGFIKGPETEFTTSWSSLTHVWPEKSSSSLFSSVTQSCPTLCNHMDCSTPGLPVHHQLLEFTQTNVHWVGDAIQPSHPLSPPSPPTFNLSQHRGLLKRVSFLHQVAKVLELQLQHPSNEYPGLISFRMDWLDLLAVQGTPKSLLQYHSSKISILWCLAFLIV